MARRKTIGDFAAAQRALRRKFLPKKRGARASHTLPPPRQFIDAKRRAGAGIHAIAIGRKEVKGKLTPRRAVVVFVTQKLPLETIRPQHRIPKRIRGIPTDVVVRPPAFMHAGVQPGASAAHVKVNVGTLGAFCRSAEGPVVLSNNHVFANLNAGAIGDPILTPSRGDAPQPKELARLKDFQPVRLDGTPNLIDCAIGELNPNLPVDPNIPVIGRIRGSRPPAERLLVCKRGRSTDYTRGIIRGINWEGDVGFVEGGTVKKAFFVSQLWIEPIPPFTQFALNGDSGSIVVELTENKTPRAVGLYFAGAGDGSWGLANPIGPVLQRLGIEFA